jgi:hypothetical protein
MQVHGLNSYTIEIEMKLDLKTTDGSKMGDYGIDTLLRGEYVEGK